MTEEIIKRTFEAASTIICQLQLDGKIDMTEAEIRLDRARKICTVEMLRALGLRVKPVSYRTPN
jgi:hypothetical protein